MAWAPVVQAVAGAVFGPLRPGANRDVARRQVDDGGGNEKRRDAPRAVIEIGLILPLDDIEAADSAADANAGALLLALVDLEPRRGEREFGRRDGELNEAPHFLDFFFFDVVPWIERLDFAGDLAGKRSRVERLNPRDSASPFPQRLPGFVSSDSQRRHQAYARDDNPARHNPSLLLCNMDGNLVRSYFLDVLASM